MLPRSIPLDPRLHSVSVHDIEQQLKQRVAGQDGPISQLAGILETYFAGYGDPNTPVGVVMFLGPSGVGKTSLIENLCDILYGNPKAHVRLNCADFKDSHQTRSLRPAGPNTRTRGRGRSPPAARWRHSESGSEESFRPAYR
jgi:type VI secretion system protein VasG